MIHCLIDVFNKPVLTLSTFEVVVVIVVMLAVGFLFMALCGVCLSLISKIKDKIKNKKNIKK